MAHEVPRAGEDPLKLVANFLKERGVAGAPVGFEETNRFFILDRLKQQLPDAQVVSANPVVRAQRMIKSPAELALMQAAADVTGLTTDEARAELAAGKTLAQVATEHGKTADGGPNKLHKGDRITNEYLDRRGNHVLFFSALNWLVDNFQISSPQKLATVFATELALQR